MVLDCTLRDGGYYNNWNFDESLVDKYISAVSSANIDIVEIGFRFISKNNTFGHFAYSTDKYLKQLLFPKNIDIAVMIDAKEYINFELGADAAIDLMFSNRLSSPVDIVRIATNIDNIDSCKLLGKKLNSLGYRVFLNLMQIDSIKKPALQNIVKHVGQWNCIEVFYFADSFGNMNVESITNIVKTIRKEWHGEIGIHAHDNKGHALINSISAISSGVTYVDATILGMGRGAGNTKMENLLVEIVDRNLGNYTPDAIFPLALQEFNQLQEKYRWGSSIYYYLSAVHGIHPTYVQEMLGDGRYDISQLLSAIDFLKTKSTASYKLENMLEALSNSVGDEHGSWFAKDWIKGRDVLIIGSGPSTKKHISKIISHIENTEPVVLCLNINKNIPEEFVDAYIACHETRIAIELDLYQNLTKPIILPMGKIPTEIKKFLSNVDVLDYGLKIKENSFISFNNGCFLDKPLVLLYALSLLSISGANRVRLTGIDGYDGNNTKQEEMLVALNEFRNNNNIELCAITPTTYPIEECFLEK